MAGAEGSSTSVGNQPHSLVPSFTPGVDDLQTYQQKVELLASIWPKAKISELTARLILNSKGSAFAKLQLHQKELPQDDDLKAIKRVIELLGGHWGRVGLEERYQEAEDALFNCAQRSDESNDSYLTSCAASFLPRSPAWMTCRLMFCCAAPRFRPPFSRTLPHRRRPPARYTMPLP